MLIIYLFMVEVVVGGEVLSRTGLLSNRSGAEICSATVGAGSVGPGSHYTETARKLGSETETEIKEDWEGWGAGKNVKM